MKTNVTDSRLVQIVERAVFSYRLLLLLIFFLTTLFLGYRAAFVRPDTNLEKMVPQGHIYIKNAHDFLAKADANGKTEKVDVRIGVAVNKGDIFSKDYLTTLKNISDDVSLLPGVDTGALKSLWTPAVRWDAVTKEGFDGGPIIGSFYDGSPRSIDRVRANLLKSMHIGSYVSNDFKASMITLPVIKIDPKTKDVLDFQVLSHALEKIRDKYQTGNLNIYIIGDVKKFADLTDGFTSIGVFFAIAIMITAVLLYLYSHCLKSTIATLACSIVAVVWQLGILNLMGYGIGVFSVLVPFLVFAIGISHGVQIINMIVHESALGKTRLAATRIAFCNLFKPGLLALFSDGIGFATLMVINVGVIQDLAIAASTGVAVIIITNLILLPLIMSYLGVTHACIRHCKRTNGKKIPSLFQGISKFTDTKPALVLILIALVITGGGLYFSRDLKIGDLDKGAPELRPNSRYNTDNQYITTHFSTSTDEMDIFVETPPGKADSFKTTDLLNRFEWILSNTPGVQSVTSAASTAKFMRYGNNEANLKLFAVPRRQQLLSAYSYWNQLDAANSLSAVKVELSDHKEETLVHVVRTVEAFAAEHNDPDISFSLGYGNGVYEAATNQVISGAQYLMMACVYGVVSLMCLITFRSWRPMVCIILPLVMTSVLCQALMALLNIGIKVGTLPVIALGVGIGVDYGIYIYSRLESFLGQGLPLRKAYLETLMTTGKAVCFTGLTLAIGVGTWIFSPIKFQGDMGILLTFMFVWNMVGALVLLPALASFLVAPQSKKAPAEHTPGVLSAGEPEDEPPLTFKSTAESQQA